MRSTTSGIFDRQVLVFSIPLALAACLWVYDGDWSGRSGRAETAFRPVADRMELRLVDGWAYRQIPELGLVGPVELEPGLRGDLVAIDDGWRALSLELDSAGQLRGAHRLETRNPAPEGGPARPADERRATTSYGGFSFSLGSRSVDEIERQVIEVSRPVGRPPLATFVLPRGQSWTSIVVQGEWIFAAGSRSVVQWPLALVEGGDADATGSPLVRVGPHPLVDKGEMR